MKSALIVLSLFIGFSASAAKINFQKFTNLDDALKQSKEAGKPLFIDSWASWCGWCTYMDENIFNDDAVAEYFNENFICFKANADANNTMDFRIKI